MLEMRAPYSASTSTCRRGRKLRSARLSWLVGRAHGRLRHAAGGCSSAQGPGAATALRELADWAVTNTAVVTNCLEIAEGVSMSKAKTRMIGCIARLEVRRRAGTPFVQSLIAGVALGAVAA